MHRIGNNPFQLDTEFPNRLDTEFDIQTGTEFDIPPDTGYLAKYPA